jgi:hypothetical protein
MEMLVLGGFSGIMEPNALLFSPGKAHNNTPLWSSKFKFISVFFIFLYNNTCEWIIISILLITVFGLIMNNILFCKIPVLFIIRHMIFFDRKLLIPHV